MKSKTSNLCSRLLLAAVFAAVIAALPAPGAADETKRIAVLETDEGVLFTESGKDVLFYQKAPKSLEGSYTRSNYVHPLYNLDGAVLTEDFPKDHLHHRGVFSAWHQLLVGNTPVGDQWSLTDFSYDVQDVRILKTSGPSVALKARVLWKSPLWKDASGTEKPFVEETTIIRVHPSEKDIRKIDFEIRLLALEENFQIGGADNDKEYGGFSVRVQLPSDVVFTGANGPIQPLRTPTEASPWLDISGRLTGGKEPEGVAILCHPTLPDFPQQWILRKARSMQNPVWPGMKPVPLSTGEPVVLRYRLVVHRGNAAEAGIAELQKEYEKEPLPTDRE